MMVVACRVCLGFLLGNRLRLLTIFVAGTTLALTSAPLSKAWWSRSVGICAVLVILEL